MALCVCWMCKWIKYVLTQKSQLLQTSLHWEFTETLLLLFWLFVQPKDEKDVRNICGCWFKLGTPLCVCVCFVIICVNLQITCFLPFFESFSACVFLSCAFSHLLLGLPPSLSVCSFVYETEHFNGVAELLEILGRYVGGLWASDTHLHSALLLLMLLAWVTETWERQQNSTQLCYLAVVL